MSAATTQRVVALIAELLAVPAERVTPEARLREDLGADSLDAFELVVDLEDEFGVEIPDADAGAVYAAGATVQTVIDMLAKAGVYA